jgi:hypothetical protein
MRARSIAIDEQSEKLQESKAPIIKLQICALVNRAAKVAKRNIYSARQGNSQKFVLSTPRHIFTEEA